jgi:hypothetical protein
VEVKTKNGQIRVLQISEESNPIYKDGKMIGILANALDITDRKRATEALQAKIDELEKFQKLTVGREMKMVELKNRIQELEAKLKEKP